MMGSGVSGLAQIGGVEKEIVDINEEDSVFVVAFYSVVVIASILDFCVNTHFSDANIAKNCRFTKDFCVNTHFS